MRTLANNVYLDEMQHFVPFHQRPTLFADTKTILRERNTILFGNCNL